MQNQLNSHFHYKIYRFDEHGNKVKVVLRNSLKNLKEKTGTSIVSARHGNLNHLIPAYVTGRKPTSRHQNYPDKIAVEYAYHLHHVLFLSIPSQSPPINALGPLNPYMSELIKKFPFFWILPCKIPLPELFVFIDYVTRQNSSAKTFLNRP